MKQFFENLRYHHGGMARRMEVSKQPVFYSKVYRPERPMDFVPRSDPRYFYLGKR